MTSIKSKVINFAPAIAGLLFLVAVPYALGSVVTSLATKIIIFALLAMALDIVFGYTGLWSFCHAALFGVGGYTVAMIVNYTDITSFFVIAPAGIIMATIAAAIFGLIALRASGIYFLLITVALGQLVFGSIITQFQWTKGYDGLGGIPYPEIGLSLSTTTFYYFALVIVVICIFLLYRLIKSPFGHSLEGVRDRETRMRILGYNTWQYKFIAFVISGFFAGVAGVLYAFYNGIMTPSDVGFAASGVVIMLVIIGGSGTFWGALISSVVIFVLNFYISSITTDRWPMVLGVIFIAVVMFARSGIFPALNNLWTKAREQWKF